MGNVVLQNVTKQFGAKVVLEELSLEIRTGEIVGLVGPNGCGKTTIFKIIAGIVDPDIGNTTRSKGLEIGYLSQEPELDSSNTLRNEVSSAFCQVHELESKLLLLSEKIAENHDGPGLSALLSEYERLESLFHSLDGHQAEVRIDEVIGGLGFSLRDRNLPIQALSGGQKCRASLAKLLLHDNELLLLDEPTNHLDLDATRWLERFLAGHHGGAVLVSHDRYLLDKLVTKIIEVENRTVKIWPGNYSHYLQQKELQRLSLERQAAQDRLEIDKQMDFIRKHMAGQRTKEAKGRLARLQRRMRAGEFVTEAPSEKKKVKIKFGEIEQGGNTIVQCEGLGKAFGEKALFENLTFDVYRGHRLGIMGPNGSGKTTLLKILLGIIEPSSGKAKLFESLKTGYYEQEHGDIQRTGTVIDELQSARPDMREGELRSFLGKFLFSGDDVFKPLGKCSGGEQSRVRLARLILQNPQVLILDEPTNHLDIPSREALEDALEQYEGTIICVSHDRFFLDRIVDRLLILDRHSPRLIIGNYSDYERLLEEEQAQLLIAEQQAIEKKRAGKRKKQPACRNNSASKYDGMSIEQLEELLIDKEATRDELTARFATPEVYNNPELTREIKQNLLRIDEEICEIDRIWHERADTL